MGGEIKGDDFTFWFNGSDPSTAAKAETLIIRETDNHQDFMMVLTFDSKFLNPPCGSFYTEPLTNWYSSPINRARDDAHKAVKDLYEHLLNSGTGALELLQYIDELQDKLKSLEVS